MINNNYDFVISGLGPAALEVAYHALKANKKVLLISDRPQGFLRVQNVFLDDATRYLLKKLITTDQVTNVEDQKFLTALGRDVGIAIKDIERFLFRRLQDLPQHAENLTILYESTIQDINFEKGKVGISQNKSGNIISVNFTDTLIGADGHKHHVLDVLTAQNNLPERPVQQIHAMEKLHKFNVTAYVTIKSADGRPLSLPEHPYLTGVYNRLFYGLRLHKEKYEKEESTPTALKVSVVCELPPEIYSNKENPQVVLDYIKKLITFAFKQEWLDNNELTVELTKSKKYGAAKDKLKLLTFESFPTQYQLPVYVKGDKSFFQLGDALLNPDYRFGGGLILALQQANYIGFMLNNPEYTLQIYKDSNDEVFKQLQNKSIGLFAEKDYQRNLAEIIDKKIREEYTIIRSKKCTIL